MPQSENRISINSKSSIIWEAIERDITNIIINYLSPQFSNSNYLNLPAQAMILAEEDLKDAHPGIDLNSREAIQELPWYISLPNKVKALLSTKAYLSSDQEKAIRMVHDNPLVFKIKNHGSRIQI